MDFFGFDIQTNIPIPAIAAAIIVLILGFIVGKVTKQFVLQLAEATGVRQKVRFGIEREAKKFGFSTDFIYLFALVLKYFIYIIAIFLALRILNIQIGMNTILTPLISYAPNILSAIIIVIAGSAVIEIIADILRYKLKDQIDEKAGKAGLSNLSVSIANYVRFFLYLIIFIAAFLQLGIKVEGLLTLVLSIGIIALGSIAILTIFSLKDHLPHVTSGVYLANNKILAKGDVLQLDNISGEVEEVTLLFTIIKSKNATYYIPNAKIAQSVFSIVKKG